MSLPNARRIAHGRTHSQSWNALDYACPVKGYVAAPQFGKACKAVFAIVVLLICTPLVVHFIGKALS